jgi:O-antigen/teichoic acid export membrane protein
MVEAGEDHGGDRPGVAPPLRRIAVRGARLALIGWGSSQGLNFVAYIALARLVSPAGFGEFAAASVITGAGGLFAESGMTAALINRRDRLDEAASTAFFSQLLGGFLISVAALAVAPLVGLYFHSSRIGELSAAMSGWLFLRALTVVPDSLLQRRFSFARRVAVDPLGVIAFAAVSITLCAEDAGAWGLVAGTYASMGVQVVSAWGFARIRPRWRLASIAMWRELAAFARPVIGSEILRHVASQMYVIMLGRFSGTATLGQYRNGLRLSQQPSNAFVDVGAYVLGPTFVRLRDHRDRLSGAARRVFGVVAATALPVSVATVPLGVPVAVLTLGSRWRPAGHAIAGLSFVLIGTALMSVTAETLKAVGRPELLIRVHGVNLAATATAVTAAAIPFGLIGVAVAVSVSQCVTGVYAFGLLTRQIDLGWRELAEEFAGPAVASAIMLAALVAFARSVHPLSHSEAGAVALTVAQVGIGLLVYAAVLTTVDRRRRGDARRLLARLRALRGSASC